MIVHSSITGRILTHEARGGARGAGDTRGAGRKARGYWWARGRRRKAQEGTSAITVYVNIGLRSVLHKHNISHNIFFSIAAAAAATAVAAFTPRRYYNANKMFCLGDTSLMCSHFLSFKVRNIDKDIYLGRTVRSVIRHDALRKKHR